MKLTFFSLLAELSVGSEWTLASGGQLVASAPIFTRPSVDTRLVLGGGERSCRRVLTSVAFEPPSTLALARPDATTAVFAPGKTRRCNRGEARHN